MFLRPLDCLSPSITLYYKSSPKHYVVFSGILSLLTYVVIFAFAVYFFLEFFNKQNPTSYFFNKFIEDAGYFPFNSSSLFHYITIGINPDPIDYQSVRIIGVSTFVGVYTEGIKEDLNLIDHWVYGNCEASDIKGIESVIEDKDSFLKGACVRKWWNATEQKYYSVGDEEFFYPSFAHGASNPNFTTYSLVIERCKNSTGVPYEDIVCNTPDVIKDYIANFSPIQINMVDQYIDVGNYTQPAMKYIYKLSNAMFEKTYVQNHLNFNPAIIRTHTGIIFETITEQNTYIFQQNEKITEDTNSLGTICCFCFWLQNRIQFYERTYIRIQDVLANIGGVSKIIFSIAIGLNYVLHRFSVLVDTTELYNNMLSESFGIQKPKEIKNSLISVNLGDLSSKYHGNNTTLSKSSILLKERDRTESNIYGKGFLQSRFTKVRVTFMESLKDLVCFKENGRKTKIDILTIFRNKYLSEEILCKYYIANERSKELNDRMGNDGSSIRKFIHSSRININNNNSKRNK